MAEVATAIQKPVQEIANFGKQWGIPLVTGVAGFAAGDFLNVKGMVAERLKVQSLRVLGFSIDVTNLFSVMVYAIAAVTIMGFLAGKGGMLGLLGRSGFAFFAGAMARILLEMFNITQTLVEVS